MELTSSKLRLASSVSSIEFKSSRFSKRLIAVVVLCVMLAVGGGFLLGYFVKGNNSDDICGHCNSNANTSQTNDLQPNFDDVKKIFSQFEKEVSVEELRNNLRYAVIATIWVHFVGLWLIRQDMQPISEVHTRTPISKGKYYPVILNSMNCHCRQSQLGSRDFS